MSETSEIEDLGLSRRERKKRQARGRIYEAAMELFDAQGYERTTVQEITDRADVAKGTFFNHYPTKESVLLEYHGELGDRFLELADEIESETTSARDRLEAFFRGVARIAAQEGPRLKLVIQQVLYHPSLMAAQSPVPREYQSWAFLWRPVLDRLEGFLEDGKRRGGLDPELDVATATTVLASVWTTTLIQWAYGPPQFSLLRAMEKRLSLMFRGFAKAR